MRRDALYLALTVLLTTAAARADWTQTAAGPYDYNTTSNWAGGIINGWFSSNIAANQTVTFASDTVLSTGWTFTYGGGAFDLTLRGTGGDRFITLGGNVGMTSVFGNRTTTIGGTPVAERLYINLGGADRTFNVAATDTLILLNAVSNGGVTKTGAGTLVLSGNNTYAGGTTVKQGVLNASGGSLGTGSLTVNSSAGIDTTVNLTGNHTVSGLFGTVTGGGTATINLSTAATTLTINQSTAATFAGTVTGAGGIVKASGADLTLSGTNSYAGGTTFSGSYLGAFADSGLGDAAGGLTFNGGSLWVRGTSFTSTARTITWGGAGGGFWIDPGATFTVSQTLTGTGGLVKEGSGTLVLSGDNTYTGTTTVSTGTLQIGDGGTTGSVTGNIVNNSALVFNRSDTITYGGIISGGGSLTKTGAGTLTLAGANTYTGTATVNGGTLQFAKTNSLYNGNTGSWTASNIIVNSGATLALNVGGTGEFAVADVQKIAGLGSANGGFASGSFLGLDTSNSSGGTFTYSNLLANPNGNALGLVKLGSGALVLTGANTYTGATTISAGTLQIGAGGTAGSIAGDIVNDSALVFNRSDALTYVGVISGAGGVTKTGAGDLTITGSNTYSGGTTVSAGTLQIGAGGAAGSVAGDIVNNSALIFSRSDAVTYGGIITGAGSLTKTGAGTLTLVGDNTYSGVTTVSAGTLQIGAGGTTGSVAGNIVNNSVLVFSRSDAVTYGGIITGAGSLTKTGAGTLTLSGANTYAGGTNLNGGTLSLGSSGAIGASGIVSFGGGTLRFSSSNTTDYSSRFSTAAGQAYSIDTNGETVTFASALTSSGGSLTKTGAGTLTLAGLNTYSGVTTITSGTLQIGAGGAAGSVAGDIVNNASLIFNRAGALTYGGVISGTGAVTKTGGGDLTLAASNTYTGGTTFAGGYLGIASDNALGSASGGLTFNGGRLWVQGTSFTSTARTITWGSSGGGFWIDPGATFTVSQTLAGSGGLVKEGGGTLVLGGDNTYTGTTTVSTGTLRIGAGGTAGSVAGNIVNNGALVFDRSDSLVYGGVISGTGALNKSGGGDLTLTATNDYYGGTIFAGGYLGVSSDSALGYAFKPFGGLIFNGGGLWVQGTSFTSTARAITWDSGGGGFRIDPGATFTVSQTLTGSGGLLKEGNGTLVLSGANTYSGGTTFAGGYLAVSSDGALGSASGGLTFDGGSLWVRSTFSTDRTITLRSAGGGFWIDPGATFTVSQAVTGSGGLVNQGNGTLILTGNNTYSGGTTIAGGYLGIFSDNALGNASGGLTFNGGSLWVRGTSFTSTARTITWGGAGGGFWIDPGATFTVSQTLAGTGGLLKGGGGTLVLTGANTYSGTTTVGTGTLQIGDGGTAGSVAGNIVNNASLVFNRADALTYAGVISGTGGVIKFGGGDLTLTGSNTYSGGTTFAGGYLEADADARLGAASGGLTFNGGSLRVRGTSFTFTLRPITLGSAGGGFSIDPGATFTVFGTLAGSGRLLKEGAGTVVLFTGVNAYSGGTTFAAGYLGADSDGALGSASGGLTFDGGSLWVRGTSFTSTARAITWGSAGGGFWIDPGATFTVSQDLTGSGGLVKEGNGTLILTGNNTYSGGTTFSGGLGVSSDHALGSASGGLTFNGGTFWVQGTSFTSTARNITWGSAGGGFRIDPGSTFTVSQTLTGTGGLLKEGNGTLVLSGANTYSGATTVSAGTLLLNGSLTGAGGPVTVNSGGTLGGSGSIQRNVTVNSGGHLAPGNSPGIMTVAGALNMSAGSFFDAELNGAAAGTGYDQILVSSGSVDLGNTTLNATLGFTPTAGQLFFLVNNQTSDNDPGTFNGLADKAFLTIGGWQFQISYGADVAGNAFSGGNDVALLAVQPVPEPTLLLAGGLAGMLAWRRLRRS